MRNRMLLTGLILAISFLNAAGSDSLQSSRAINFYIIDKPKTVDLFARLVIMRAKTRARKSKEKMVVFIVSSAKEMNEKITEYLAQRNEVIGTLWFDSHGKYKNGYSSFSLGMDEFSWKTLKDTSYQNKLKPLAAFCTPSTKIAIGSCYGGATFERPVAGTNIVSRMNGDSLMMGIASILPSVTVYGAESWVMTKPGIFQRHSYALSGYPIQKRFRDESYKPVWERMGIWNRYSSNTGKFETINSIALNRKGSLEVKHQPYLSREKSQKRLAKNLQKLEPGIIKIKT